MIGFQTVAVTLKHWRKGSVHASLRVARCSALEEDRVLPGFRTTDGEAKPKESFLPVEDNRKPLSPNARVLAQIQESMERLGASPKDIPPPAARRPADLSGINPLSAYAGAAGAGLISWMTWTLLQAIVQLYVTHPLQTDFYVVLRISSIIRITIVGLLSLASGMSGVTSIGLLLLAGRTTIGVLTGEFRKSSNDNVDSSAPDDLR